MRHSRLLTLLQLSSPTLPVGAYSYSEGIETLAAQGKIAQGSDLLRWLSHELSWGAIRVETAVMLAGYRAVAAGDIPALQSWNQWLSAFRDTEETRAQSWQMGRSLLRLFADLEASGAQQALTTAMDPCNYAIAYGIVTHAWEVPPEEASLAYLHGWAANLISAAVRSVPLGQTEGQRILRQLAEPLQGAQQAIQQLAESELAACSWGTALASMQHETQYSRLFRS